MIKVFKYTIIDDSRMIVFHGTHHGRDATWTYWREHPGISNFISHSDLTQEKLSGMAHSCDVSIGKDFK